MTDPLQALIDQLRTLEAQWREKEQTLCRQADNCGSHMTAELMSARAYGIGTCADELAAALAGSAGIPSSLNSETEEEDLTRRDSLPLTEAPQPAPTDWDPSSPWPEGYSSYWRCVRCGQVYSSPTTGKPPAQCLCPPAGVVTVTVSSQSQSSAILKSSVSRRSGNLFPSSPLPSPSPKGSE